MTRIVFVLAAALLPVSEVFAAQAQADPQAQSAALAAEARTWLSHLEDALTQTALLKDYQKGNIAQVAGVRGARQDAASPNPVWKGGFADEAKTELKKERAALAKGVSLLVKGSLADGRAEILAFKKDYPNSRLIGAALEALRKIDALSGTSSR